MTMNKNMLSPLGFSFHVKKLPEFNFFVQSVTLPGINLGVTEQPTPFKTLPVFGDHVTFGDLVVSFKINEDLGNYIELFNWIRGIGFPNEYPEFAELQAQELTGDGVESDAYLMIMSSAHNPLIRIDFEDIFPYDLSDITMDARDAGLEYLEASISFKFKKYSFVQLPGSTVVG